MFHRGHIFRGLRPERLMQRGDIKYIILDFLKDKPGYGYEIIRALEKRFYGFYSPSPGTVYPTLQMLEEMGCVTSSQQDGKKVYTITDEGRKFLAEREEQFEKRARGWWPPESIEDIRETMREFHRLAELLRSGAHSVNAEKLARVRKAIAHAHEEVEAILRE